MARRCSYYCSAFKIGLAAVVVSVLAVAAPIPRIAGFICSALPLAWSALRTWLTPPYLFLTVHLIVLLIWKLSTANSSPRPSSSGSRSSPEAAVVNGDHRWPPLAETTVKDVARQELMAVDASSPVKRISANHATRRVAFANSSTAGGGASKKKMAGSVKKAAAPVVTPALKHTRDVDNKAIGAVVQAEADDSIDGTWRAIMSKSRCSGASEGSAGAMAVMRSSGGSTEEMNRRFEEFIRKGRQQILRGS